MRNSLFVLIALVIGCGDDDGMTPVRPCPAGTVCDADEDGWESCAVGEDPTSGVCDCDDTIAGVHPPSTDAREPASDCNDGIDQNCDGRDRLCDLDGDGVPADRSTGGFPDCDDTDPEISPDQAEICDTMGGDGVDNDCNGYIDEVCMGDDLDGDGVDYCRPGGPATCDCDDCRPDVRPGLDEVACNGIDEDCNGSMTPCTASDGDADGFAGPPAGPDCDDADAHTFPGAPERCDTPAEESCGAHPSCASDDLDGDGWAEPPSCEGNPDRIPTGDETCNALDDDCDGAVDEALPEGTGCAAGTPIDLMSDLYNCGGCRVVCNAGGARSADRCMDGVCDCSGEPGVSPCSGPPTEQCCTAGCVDTLVDVRHCGECDLDCAVMFGDRIDRCAAAACSCGGGSPCADGQICRDGVCS